MKLPVCRKGSAMDGLRKSKIWRHSMLDITLACMLLLSLSACTSVPTTATDISSPVLTSSTPSPFPSVAAPPTLTSLPEPTATSELSNTGPWWIASAPENIWIMNTDGTSITTLDIPGETRFYPSNLSVAPDGRHLAFRAGYQLAEGTSLYIVHLPEGAYQRIDILQPFADFSIDDFYPGTASYDMSQANTALNRDTSFAWSPDSSQLAFLGMIDGSSVDLYLYDLGSGNITQLTDGPSQTYQVYWSPDGRYLLHAGVDSFGTGAGYSMAGLWAVDVPRNSINDVEMGMLRGDFIFHGWLDDETFLAASFSAVCGDFNLRAVNLRTGQVEVIWPSSYGAFAIDPSTWTMLLDAPDYAAGDPHCNGQGIAGLLLVDGNGEARQMDSGVASHILWSEALDAFIVELEEGVNLLSRDGTVLENLPAMPCLLPNNADWAFMTGEPPGFWVGPAGTVPGIAVFDCDDRHWAWNPDGSMVSYMQNNVLFTAQSPEFIPAPAEENLTPPPSSLQWAEGN